MRLLIGGATVAAGALIALAPPAPAADTMRLGVSSLSAHAAPATVAAPTLTLKGTDADKDADTEDVYISPYRRGYFHGSHGFPYRPWIRPYWGFYRPYGGFYRPWSLGLYRPWSWGGFYPGLSIGFSTGYYSSIGTGVSIAVAPASAGICCDPPTTYSAPPATYAPPLAPNETLPAPRSNETYRYDGGPPRPVPMPNGTVPTPMGDPELPPANVPAFNRVKATPVKKKIAYPAYGEELPPPKPTATGNPLLVKYPGQK